jgi:23S rRNA (adenine-N6)-dimethyltransferase
VRAGDLVLDIGAGTGALTCWLVEHGARVVAVELHPRRAGVLRRRFDERVVVVQTDAGDLRLPRRPFRVVANPPFAATTAIMRRLLTPGSRLLGADLVVPRHVARRWVAPGAPGRARWSKQFMVERGGNLPRHAFDPPTRADAVVLRIRRRGVRR